MWTISIPITHLAFKYLDRCNLVEYVSLLIQPSSWLWTICFINPKNDSYDMSHVWNTPICKLKFFINTLLPKITHLPIIQHIRIKWAIILIRSWYRSNDIVLLDQLPLMKSNWSLGETDKEPRNPFRCRSQLAISMLYRWPKSFRNYFKESAISWTSLAYVYAHAKAQKSNFIPGIQEILGDIGII